MRAGLGVDMRVLRSAWVRLVLSIRLLAGVTAVVLLAVHRVTEHDPALIVAGGHEGKGTVVALHIPDNSRGAST